MSDVVLEEAADGISLLTLNRPHRLNALTSDTLDEIFTSFEQVSRDTMCRVLIVTGAGRGFCAGDDLFDYKPPAWVPADIGAIQSNMLQQKHVASLVPRMRSIPQPVIAAINGPVAGAGYALALGADLRLASESAVFANAFVKIGASGCELGLSWLLQRIVGATRAAELVLTGRRLGAEEAERIGLVLRVVPDGTVVDAALELAAQIAANTPFGTWMGKSTLWSNLEVPSLEAAIDLEARTQILALATEDAVEQREAMREKREPKYRNR